MNMLHKLHKTTIILTIISPLKASAKIHNMEIMLSKIIINMWTIQVLWREEGLSCNQVPIKSILCNKSGSNKYKVLWEIKLQEIKTKLQQIKCFLDKMIIDLRKKSHNQYKVN